MNNFDKVRYFLNEDEESQDPKIIEIEEFLRKYKVQNYKINKDYSVDVTGLVNLRGLPLETIPVKFGKVTGEFDVTYSKITSLKNSPKYVEKFDCSNNKSLTSLEEGPQSATTYDCSKNKLLKSLKGAPKEMNEGTFSCSECSLTSLEGSPQSAGRFFCDGNQLTSLKGSPKYVGTKTGGLFDCKNNKLTTLEGAPKKVKGSFYCAGNPGKFSVKDVEKVSSVSDSIFAEKLDMKLDRDFNPGIK